MRQIRQQVRIIFGEGSQMRKPVMFLATVILVLIAAGSQALTIAQLTELRTAVLEMCRGGTIIGESSRINVNVSGEGKIVVIKGLLEGGADARVEITNEQWTGIQALINPETYTQCVTETLGIVVPALNN